jgi:transcriptional regulator with XRE-family HTH domain
MAKRKREAKNVLDAATPLDLFCIKNGITTPELAAVANVSRQHTNEIRQGRCSNTTISTAKMLAQGASIIVRRKVAVAELFDLDFYVDNL